MSYLNRRPRLERRSLYATETQIQAWASSSKQFRGWLETRNGIVSLRLDDLSMKSLARENLSRIRRA